jgi:maleylacetate reductase
MYSGTYETFATERVIYGKPAATALAAEARRLEAERVFLVVSQTLERDTGWVDAMRTALGDRYAGSFSGVPSHTPRETVLAATEQARLNGADLLVSFGGGSVTDTAKMMQLALKHDLRRVEEFDRFVVRVKPDGTRHIPEYDGPDVRMIAIPTTLSGGEFNRTTGATDTRTKLKELYRHDLMVPRVVILDPAMTVKTPEWLWLSTGIRAFDHAVETICNLHADPLACEVALLAVRLLAQALPASKADPGDMTARLNAQIAVWQSMEHNRQSISMGASHGIGHVLGGTCDVPHGYTSCIMLPTVLRYNEPANAERQKMIATAMGRPGEPAWQVAHAFIAGLGLPRRLADVGVGPNMFPRIAEAALLDHYLHTNPRPIASAEDIMDILRMAA